MYKKQIRSFNGLRSWLFLLAYVVAFVSAEAAPAHFVAGATTIVETFTVDNKAKTLKLKKATGLMDGMVVELEANTLNAPVSLSVGYTDGTMHVNSGSPSKLVIALIASDETQKFNKPIKVSVNLGSRKNASVVAYAILPDGKLRTLDSTVSATGWLTVYMSKPLKFTWISAD